MKNIKSIIVFSFFLLFITNNILGQKKDDQIKNKFEELSQTELGLNEELETSVSQISLFDFITAIGIEHKLNVSVDPDLNQIIVNNFHNVKVKNVFIFLIKKYHIDVDFVENIISFKKRKSINQK